VTSVFPTLVSVPEIKKEVGDSMSILKDKTNEALGVFGDMAAMLMKTLNVLDNINAKLDALNGKTVHTYVKVHEEKP
jgi:hypothetical protein